MHTFKSYLHGDVTNVETMDEAWMELDIYSKIENHIIEYKSQNEQCSITTL